MDPERLKEAAINKGLITPEQAAGMSKRKRSSLHVFPASARPRSFPTYQEEASGWTP